MKSNSVQFFGGHPVEEQEKYRIEKWKVKVHYLHMTFPRLIKVFKTVVKVALSSKFLCS